MAVGEHAIDLLGIAVTACRYGVVCHGQQGEPCGSLFGNSKSVKEHFAKYHYKGNASTAISTFWNTAVSRFQPNGEFPEIMVVDGQRPERFPHGKTQAGFWCSLCGRGALTEALVRNHCHQQGHASSIQPTELQTARPNVRGVCWIPVHPLPS
jgi:hypothetical protein